MAADILSELLITAMIDQDSNNRKGCSPWFWIFLIAVIIWIAYMFLTQEK